MEPCDLPLPEPLPGPLPAPLVCRPVVAEDLAGLVELLTATRRAAGRSGGPDPDQVLANAAGTGSWTRRQLVVLDADRVVAWAVVHDRAAGRADLTLAVHPDLPDRPAVALVLLAWMEQVAAQVARARGVETTRLEILVDSGDSDLQAWLAAHGHHHARTWLNMSREVDPAEEFPPVREGVEVRPVLTQELGDGTTLPLAADLQTVHLVLEQSFEDHFNSYRESFPEFVARLREDPGHRWDHWWLAAVDGEPGGAVVCSVTPPDADGVPGSYVEYIGVHRRARGRGVAKALLHTVLADAAERGRNRVGLEVDADSPTGADGLYLSMGWVTSYVTQSWHKDVPVQ